MVKARKWADSRRAGKLGRVNDGGSRGQHTRPKMVAVNKYT